jgi:hypothetical protein
MGCGEAIRSVGQIAWPGEAGLNNAKPGSEGRESGPGKPSEAKTPAEALSYIELLYKSGRMEDLGKLLRKSQVFRAAWLIVQQSSPDFSEAAGEGEGPSYREENVSSANLPIPVSRPLCPALDSDPESTGPAGVANTELSRITAAGMASDGGKVQFAPRFKGPHPLSLALQVYLNQEGYCATERQRGQLVSIRA